ncbi:MAG TPA: hypothetical protein VFG95_01255 [Nitrospiria bacterium]|nr:hypothetical protein [Nitrospiria bacterium]
MTHMKELYPIMAFGTILFYLTLVAVIFVHALVSRLPPLPVRIPAVGVVLEKIKSVLR